MVKIFSFSEIKSHPELFILLLVITIIAMLVIPLPTMLLDFLIGLNIVISALVFMSSFYLDRILNFSSFPAVLLITTLFRLSLSISTTRLILNDADAGEIIATFGLFVIGDNLVVGFVIFSIVTIVQFLVITKGAERVAEVAARFSLDGMPGKQMSIDADLRAGSLSSEDAADRRTVLEKESQLYGSFDGAMKFIKGDAIAGIIVIFINFIGGMAVGVSQHGMDMSSALSTYTMLTIGDGLVSQIPSLLIAISAGFIVTRVSGEGHNMGVTMMNQLFGNPFVLGISAMLALGIGTLPGFPFVVFFLLAMIPGGILLVQYMRTRKSTEIKPEEHVQMVYTHASEEREELTEGDTKLGLIQNLNDVFPITIPLILLVSGELHGRLDKLSAAERFRSQFFLEFGIHLPPVIIKVVEVKDPYKVSLLINEIHADEYVIRFDDVVIINGSDEVVNIGIPFHQVRNTVWVPTTYRSDLSDMGFNIRTSVDELYYCLANTLLLNVNEYFGVQETKDHVDKLDNDFPDLVKEVTRNLTIQRISEVMQRLLVEKISVRNTKLIMESLAVWGPREKDVIMLVEHIRGALSRYISHKFAIANSIKVVLLSNDIEDQIRQSIRMTSGGTFLNMEPDVAEKMMDSISAELQDILISHKDYVILCSVDIRRFVKRFLENKFKGLEVLSHGEIADSISVDVIKSIR